MAEKKAAFDKELVEDLAKILNETDLTEIEVEHGDMRVRVSREPAQQIVSQQVAPAPAPTAAAPITTASAPVAEPSPKAARGSDVPSPMVGTAYLSPSPDASPFVEVGTKISEGETLLIIEAMKTMNQIPSTRSGTVTAVLVSDGEPVEFGQPLVTIE
jgi:acetyl-CoA carboxylase biotin carboxyl carrier protein